jgi:pimeloyl-ACP methyl ester carboxylesterase
MSATAASVVAAPKDGYFDSAGVRIHYIEEGVGPAIVLVHGFAGDANNWVRSGVLSALAKRHRVIAIDCRGHGLSEKPHAAVYGREMGRDVVRLLDALGVTKAHVVGYSMGAQVSGAARYLEPGTIPHSGVGRSIGAVAMDGRGPAVTDVEAREIEQRMLRSMLLRVAPTGTRPTDDDIRKESERRLAGLDTTALAAIRRSMKDTVVTPQQVTAITIPVLGVVGSVDPALKEFQELRTILPAMQLVVINGASHTAVPARPEFVEALLRFWEVPKTP